MPRHVNRSTWLARSAKERREVAEGEYDFPGSRIETLDIETLDSLDDGLKFVRRSARPRTDRRQRLLLRDLAIVYLLRKLSEREVGAIFNLVPSRVNKIRQKYRSRPQD